MVTTQAPGPPADGTRSSDAALDLIVECARAVAPHASVCLALLGPDGRNLVVSAGVGAPARQAVAAANAVLAGAPTPPDPLDALQGALAAADPAVVAVCPLILRSGRADGALLVLSDGPLTPRDRSILQAVADQATVTIERGRIYGEAQRSFNNLFIAYEAGRLFNFSQGLDEVLANITAVLSRALGYGHYAVLLREGDDLLPGVTGGVDATWLADGQARVPLARSFAQRVFEGGVSEQSADPAVLGGLTLPPLEGGAAPTSVLCAPMTTRAGSLGVIELYEVTPRAYSSDEEFLLSVLANEAASAIENARLYESLRDKESRLTMFAQKLVNSQEEERKRIARDIHDGLAQMIVGAYRYLQTYQYARRDEDFTQGLTILHDCISESRKVMSDLRPSVLDDFGLLMTLEQYLATVAAEAGWQADYQVEGVLERLSPTLETTVFRLVQEALSNARKHAAAPRVLVRLERADFALRLLVRDWGAGFDIAAPGHASDGSSHLGLVGMRERVTLVGGSFTLHSVPGQGTTVDISLPLSPTGAD